MMTEQDNMKISVRDYGPIAKAENIELCPLTVFVGPSNTGKSYLAILIYALLKSWSLRGRFGTRFLHRRARRVSFNPGADIKSVISDIDELIKLLRKKQETIRFSDFSELLQEWTNGVIADTAKHAFHEELLRCMGTSPQESHFIGKNFHLNLEDYQKKLTLNKNQSGLDSSINIGELDFSRRQFRDLRYMIFGKEEKDFPDELKAAIFADGILDRLFRPGEGMEAIYLPAARTGIMQSHRAIAGALVKRATFAGLEPVSIPTLSGIVSDFLEGIILMDTNWASDSAAKKVADKMEKNILRGSIESKISETQYPQFLYKQNNVEVPLLRASSMVSELAPIVLFVRHRVEEGNLLIIEEPEAHLHPEAQRQMAGTVVQLVRAGVKVIVTTHSDYFLEQLGNYVRLSHLSADKRNMLSGMKSLFLKEGELGAYTFKPGKMGTVVKRLGFNSENGLSPEDHDKVSSDLYNETANIIDKIENQN